ncbi:MAG: HlyD family efflux transporter periplasmic adaptor subunit [Desulforhopalus sp.]|nr:HlyD family efflux transporter periplasmic adaptor subunit [Desulforhopalus sp.]
MSQSLFSQSWYRVAPLKPRLRSHVQIHKHCYRGKDWYVIQDNFKGRHHRFSPEAYQVIGLMDGRRSLNQIWEKTCAEMGDHMPTQDEVIDLLSQLFRSDLLQTSTLPDFAELQQRRMREKKNRLLAILRSPMSVRFPLFDPDRFLTATLPSVQFLLTWQFFLIWIGVICTAVFLAVLHWTDLTSNITDSLISMENVLLISLLYPMLKVLHEFAHGYMVKRWGGEVHEIGIMLLVFMPIPYVDASASLAFRDKYKRMLVGAAGIMVEMFAAAVALLLWLNVEPGMIRSALFNIMLIAGISTLLFNGNPLIRFDAYYVLADYLEIPNLGQRSSQYVGYLCKKYLLGVEQAEANTDGSGEARWLLFYAIISFVYRFFLSIRIILFVAGKFFFIGVLLALWAGYGMLVAPLVRIIKYLLKDMHMRRKRGRIFLVVIAPIAFVLTFLVAVPVSYNTYCQGVTMAPEESQVYAGASGFITEIPVPNGSIVEPGTLLMQIEDPEVDVEVDVLHARLTEYHVRYEVSLSGDRSEAALIKEEVGRIEAELARARERQQALHVKSSNHGLFFLENEVDLPGHYVRRGTLLGYVLDQNKIRVRVVVPQADIEQVRGDIREVEVRLADQIDQVLPATVIREVPEASDVLPSMVLSLEGGGPFVLDPRSSDRPRSIERLFQFDIQLDNSPIDKVGERVYVRFEHKPEPLAWRWYRGLRRLLLRRFTLQV